MINSRLYLFIFKTRRLVSNGELNMELLIKWFLYALSLLFIAWIVPGISIAGLSTALLAAFVIGLINVFIKPVLIILTLPINILTLGLFTLVINALMFLLAAKLVSGFQISGFWSAFLGALIFSFLSVIISGID